MAELDVNVQGTPNPNAAKFVVDRVLVEGGASKSYFDPASAEDDPLGQKLFAIDGVESLLIVDNFVTVTKTPAASWDELVPRVERVLKETLATEDQ